MTDAAIHALAETVQYNCHISDARHGTDYSLCVYLMKMREYYRWEKHLPYGAALEREQVGDWLAARERLWEELEQAELRPIEIDGASFDPFDADGINARLAPQGLVYSGGLGNRAKPHFVLGDLECREHSEDYSVFVVADEYARDLTAPPAMTQGHNIFVRRESLRRMLWEKLEGWRWHRPDNALGRAFACYDFVGDLDGALDAMTDREIRTLLLHEQGEYAASRHLGEDWNGMVLDLAGTPAEIMAHAVRDHLADCMVTLPALVGDRDVTADAEKTASLHFYFGNLTAMRKVLFPGLLQAYDAWLDGAGTGAFEPIVHAGRHHWDALAVEMLELHRTRGTAAAEPIRELVEARTL